MGIGFGGVFTVKHYNRHGDLTWESVMPNVVVATGRRYANNGALAASARYEGPSAEHLHGIGQGPAEGQQKSFAILLVLCGDQVDLAEHSCDQRPQAAVAAKTLFAQPAVDHRYGGSVAPGRADQIGP